MSVLDARIMAAMAERMNRLPYVRWDRCSFGDREGSVFGWIDREDGRADFVALDFQWGDTQDLYGESVAWFAVGTNTSSARYSREIGQAIVGSTETHRDCERVEDVFGSLVHSCVELVA